MSAGKIINALKAIVHDTVHPRCKEIHASPDCECARLFAEDALALYGFKVVGRQVLKKGKS